MGRFQTKGFIKVVPTYPYECIACHKTWDVIKSVRSIDDPEPCETCAVPAVRRLAASSFSGANDWNTQDWSPALGCYIKNNRDARMIAKRRGLEEIGNEKVGTVHKHFDKFREDRTKERWAQASSEQWRESD